METKEQDRIQRENTLPDSQLAIWSNWTDHQHSYTGTPLGDPINSTGSTLLSLSYVQVDSKKEGMEVRGHQWQQFCFGHKNWGKLELNGIFGDEI